ncbi:AT-HOOK MOTIF NUCLEAR-LOCALIZED PROTEIN 17-RELATED [Salix viminalis]|uniref:AT-hook motif nuclear-localized protein n=1 Tax=Salix viminalis TaxID=40686 RepID=A0A6N2LQ95_SALVM|nr:AT-HOOK MOTIF NUCLEAR-LOCALIZED PROTEIN 17-RELATED [Salix viminalis]
MNMKGEYVERHQAKHENTPNMFSKLNPHHQHLPFSQHFQLSRESEEEDTRSTRAATPPDPIPTSENLNEFNSGGGTDGATIEVVRRPRGRPPGSKNKPKPPVVITRESEPAMSPYILEVPGGNDVVEALSRFCRRKNMGICVLTGTGSVANVTLRQPSTTPGTTITFHGRFDILSISATFLPQTTSYPVPDSLTISLAGPQGQIVGGIVARGLVAAGTVFVVAASFNNPSYHCLRVEEEGRNSGSGGSGEGRSQAVSGAGGGESGHAASGDGGGGGESCGMAMYSSHLPTNDVIWAPTARQPPPPY